MRLAQGHNAVTLVRLEPAAPRISEKTVNMEWQVKCVLKKMKNDGRYRCDLFFFYREWRFNSVYAGDGFCRLLLTFANS